MPNGIAAKGSGKGQAKTAIKQKGDNIFTRISRFIRESYFEVVKKAAWPTWDELKKFTAVVIFAIIAVGIWIGGFDFVLSELSHKFGFGVRR